MSFVYWNNITPNCYLKQCKLCLNIQKTSEYVESVIVEHNITQVICSRRQATDRCTLTKQCLSTEESIEYISSKLQKLLSHHFIPKEQSKFIEEKKNRLSTNEVLVQLDFSENYAYVARNAAELIHYNYYQNKIFPADVYYKSGSELKYFNCISMFDCTIHDAAAVYLMQQKFITESRKVVPKDKKVIYISYDAKQHFKNRYQMVDLINHTKDCFVDAE